MQQTRYSQRFPIRLPAAVRGGDSSERAAVTGNISSGGVLFFMEADFPVGSTIQFSISMPASALGTANDVLLLCVGRVTRCTRENDRHVVAAVIDEYKFQRPV